MQASEEAPGSEFNDSDLSKSTHGDSDLVNGYVFLIVLKYYAGIIKWYGSSDISPSSAVV